MLRRSQQAEGRHSQPLPSTLNEKPFRRLSKSIGSTTSASCPTLGSPAMSFAQPQTIRTISAAASGVPSPKLVGSTLLTSWSTCCSMTQLSGACVGMAAAFTGPGSGFLGPQSSGQSWPPSIPSLSGTVLLPESRCLSLTQHSWSPPPCAQWPRCQHCADGWDPARPPTHFCWWGRICRCGLLHCCALHFDTHDCMRISFNSDQRVNLSCSL